MPTVWITRGIPGSGKSTWAKHVSKEFGAVRFNMDDFRNSMGFPSGSEQWTKERGELALNLMVQGVVQAVRAGFDVVIDNTHVNMTWLNRYREALQYEDVRFRVQDFSEVPVAVCIERDSNRSGLERVGPAVIKSMARTLAKNPYRTERELEAFLNESRFELVRYNGTPGKEPAIVVDLDGTLFNMVPGGRSPYQFWRVEEDELNQSVALAVKMARAYGLRAVLSSGRDGGYRSQTVRALSKQAVVYDDLFMRNSGDRRRDDIVKHEIFWSKIAPNFDVKWCLDDRNQVVDLYRAMGIPCWQVQPGDF